MRPRALLAVSFVIALAVGAYTVLAPSGLSRWLGLRADEKALAAQVDAARQTNAALTADVKALQEDPRILEEAAREELGWVKTDELVLTLPPGSSR